MKNEGTEQFNYSFKVEEVRGSEVVGKPIFAADSFIFECIAGEATINKESKLYPFEVGTNFFMSDHTYLKIENCSDDFVYLSYQFPQQFMSEIYAIADNETIDLLQYSAPDLSPLEELEIVRLTLQKLRLLYFQENCTLKHRIAINLMQCYIYEIRDIISRFYTTNVEETPNYTNQLLDRFFALSYEHHKEHRNIRFYADQLNISPRYLHTITKKALQSSPKQVIDFYIIGTAKRLLLTSVLTNLQISEKLNFPDQATFGQFFKRNVGISPSEFKRIYK